MTCRVAAVIGMGAVVLCLAAPALAQSQGPMGLRVYWFRESTNMAASQTFEAVTGSPRVQGAGAGAEAVRLWRGLFARVAAATATTGGERVVVFENTAVSVGIPVSVEMRQIEFGLGWRKNDRLNTRVVPYIGGGFGRLHYVETSELADTEDADEYFNGYVLFAGIDVKVWSWLMVGAEVQRRGFPNAIGAAGASKAYGEHDLGGTTARVLIGIRR